LAGRFFATARFLIAGPRFAALFFAPRLAVLFFAPRFTALFFVPPRLAAERFFAPARFLIAGPRRRALFLPALRFMPRPFFFVAIAASPPPNSGHRCCANRASPSRGSSESTSPGQGQNMAPRDDIGQHDVLAGLPELAPLCTIRSCRR
jgi:hypothetical protein